MSSRSAEVHAWRAHLQQIREAPGQRVKWRPQPEPVHLLDATSTRTGTGPRIRLRASAACGRDHDDRSGSQPCAADPAQAAEPNQVAGSAEGDRGQAISGTCRCA